MTTLLTGVNDVMKRVNLISGDSGSLTSLTDSPRQTHIDNIVQTWNEVMEELFSTANIPMPNELGEDTFTLVENDRDYTLTTFNTLYWPFIDETSGQYIHEWRPRKTGADPYLDLVNTQPVPADFTGLPRWGAIRPTDGLLYLDRIPSATEVGLIYKYRFDKDISLSTAAGVFPFKDVVFRALIPVVAGVFRLEDRKDAINRLFRSNMGRAARSISNITERTHYGPHQHISTAGIFHPFHDNN